MKKNKIKKIIKKNRFTITLLLLYITSYILQSLFFIYQNTTKAETPQENINIVTIFVDKKLFNNKIFSQNIKWYSTNYIKDNIKNVKTIVFPIETSWINKIKSNNIVKILENIYFEWIKWKNSTLKWIILIWDIPLPIINQNWFIYPSIFPYVDFENQEYIYNKNTNYFEYNNNPNWQAEIRHSIIKFKNMSEYLSFFTKLKNYSTNKSNYVWKKIWYEDLIANKQYFLSHLIKNYINNFIFIDDISNKRITNSMLNLMKDEHTNSVNKLLRNWWFSWDSETKIKTPTLFLEKWIEKFLKKYYDLFWINYLKIIKDNIQLWWRYLSWDFSTPLFDSTLKKISLKDDFIINNNDTNSKPIINDINFLLQKIVNAKIEKEKYYMKMPIISKYREYKNIMLKKTINRICKSKYDNTYQNYYFWRKVSDIKNAKDFSIYRWSFRNIWKTWLSWKNLIDIQKSNNEIIETWNIFSRSVWASLWIFSTQIEANRWYNPSTFLDENELYSWNKICENFESKYITWYIPIHLNIFWKTKWYEPAKKCWSKKSDRQYEDNVYFAIRNRWWASNINLDTWLLQHWEYKFNKYNYKNAWYNIYNIWWAKSIKSEKKYAYNYLWNLVYNSLIKIKSYWYLLYPKYINWVEQSINKELFNDYTKLNYFRVYKNKSDRYDDTKSWIKRIIVQDNLLWKQKDISWIWKNMKDLYNLNFRRIWCKIYWEWKYYFYSLIDTRDEHSSPNKNDFDWNKNSNPYLKWNSYYNEYISAKNEIQNMIIKIKWLNKDSKIIWLLNDIKLDLTSINKTFDIILKKDFSSSNNENISYWSNQIKDIQNNTLNKLQKKSENINWLLHEKLSFLDNINLYNIKYSIEQKDINNKFLTWRITNLKNNLDELKSEYFNIEFNTLNTKYKSIKNIEITKNKLKQKYNELNDIIKSWSNSIWCNNWQKYYELCQSLNNFKNNLDNFKDKINDNKNSTTWDIKTKITEFYNDKNKLKNIIDELKNKIDKQKFKLSIILLKNKLNKLNKNALDTIDEYKIDKINSLTQDRPIDSPKYITFQWIWWNIVKFIYPNLYDVEVYKNINWKLTLKNVDEIKISIKNYLKKIIRNYNIKLSNELKNKTDFYNRNKDAFLLLEWVNKIASPNRTYNLYDENILINAIWDENINTIANLLYYQNITWQQRISQNNIEKELFFEKNTFNINKKIKYVLNMYLTENNFINNIITPEYNKNWYETIFINSDWEDLLISESKINNDFKNLIDKINKTKPYNNINNEHTEYEDNFLEDYTSPQWCEWVEIDWVVDILKRPKSFWCRLKSIPNSIWVEINWDNSQWPKLDKEYTKHFFDTLNLNNRNNDNLLKENKIENWNNWNTQNKLKNISVNINIQNNNIEQFKWNISIKNDYKINKIKIAVSNNIFLEYKWNKYYSWDYIQNINKTWFKINIWLKEKISWNFYINMTFFVWDQSISKDNTIIIVPWKLNKINIKSNNFVIKQWTLPINIELLDRYWNIIPKILWTCKISTNEWIFSYKWTKINNYKFKWSLNILYKSNNANSTKITINCKDELKTYNLTWEKIVNIIKWKLTVLYNWQQIKKNKQYFYELPIKRLKYIDEDKILQVNFEKLPKIELFLKWENNEDLNTILNIKTEKKLLQAWKYNKKTKIVKWKTLNQYKFIKINKIGLYKKVTIYFMPNYKVWNEKITIEIPWFEKITIPIKILPSLAYKTNIKFSEKLNKINTISKWKIYLYDIRWNKITKDTKIIIKTVNPIKIYNENEKIFNIKNWEWDIIFNTENNWWIWHILSYIDTWINKIENQQVFYKKISIQNKIFNIKNINWMYINLFWNDRWNLRWYFSDNNNIQSTLLTTSKKALSLTTQLFSTNKIKKISIWIDNNNQIYNFDKYNIFLWAEQNLWLFYDIYWLWKIYLWNNKFNTFYQNKTFSWKILNNYWNTNSIFYKLNINQNITWNLKIKNNSILLDWNIILNLNKNIIWENIKIKLSEDKINWKNIWYIFLWEIKIWELILNTKNKVKIDLFDKTYITWQAFLDCSTNWNLWIWIYDWNSIFNFKQKYKSIENSSNPKLWIWFKWDFKNITLFSQWQSVWESTIPFWSPMLINFWDPFIKKISKNKNIEKINLNSWIWKNIYSSPWEKIFDVKIFDFNNDWLKDILVIYSNWKIKILKNYWWNKPFKNIQNLMYISVWIKKIFIWDVDWNNYEDIIIKTNNNKLRVYTNDRWIFDVDWYPICLDINWNTFQQPNDISNIKQIFFNYMNENINSDKKSLDIITNDIFGNIKIFYWWTTNWHINYVSNNHYYCDKNRKIWQKNNTKLVYKFWIKINDNILSVDNSLVHRKWLKQIKDNIEVSNTFSKWLDDKTLESLKDSKPWEIKDIITNQITKNIDTNKIINIANAWMNNIFKYKPSPINKKPSYETTGLNNIYYIPIKFLSWNDNVEIYKKYSFSWNSELNSWDIVKISIIIKANKNSKITYLEKLLWPWIIEKNKNWQISSLWINSIVWNLKSTYKIDNILSNKNYLFMIDNLELNKWNEIEIYYNVKYKPQTLTTIKLINKNIKSINIKKDNYNDIQVNLNNWCVNFSWIFENKKEESKLFRTYFQNIRDFWKECKNSNNLWNNEWSWDNIQNVLSGIINMDNIISENTSDWNFLWLLKDQLSWLDIKDIIKNWAKLNLNNINVNLFSNKFSKLDNKIDWIIKWACNWFDVNSNCPSPLPIPFNMDILSPWNFNIFWCQIKPKFKWLPIFFFPWTLITPWWPVPIPYWLKWPWDSFIRAPWWTYPSMIRIYATPTLTMKMWLSICFWPMAWFSNIPPLIWDVWGNCIVFWLSLPCQNSNNNTWDKLNYNKELNECLKEKMESNSCKWDTVINKNDDIFYYNIVWNNTWIKLFTFNIKNNSFDLVGRTDSSIYPTPVFTDGSYIWSLIDFDTIPEVVNKDYDNIEWWIEVKIWPEIKNKVLWWNLINWLSQCLIQKWLDKQIKYVINNLTKFTISITFPDFKKYLTNIKKTYNNIKNLDDTWNYYSEDEKKWYIEKLKKEITINNNDTNFEKLIKIWKVYTQEQEFKNFSEITKYPSEWLENLLKDLNIIKINTKDINIKIPLIASEDIVKYIDYLKTWVETNKRILQQRDYMLKEVTQQCIPNTDSKLKQIFWDWINIIDTDDYTKKLENLYNNLDLNTSLEDAELKEKLRNMISKQKKCDEILKTNNLKWYLNFKQNSEKLFLKIEENIKTLEEYKKFPLELYDRVHVSDRYISETLKMLWDLSYNITNRMYNNSLKIKQMSDAFVTFAWSLKTRDVILDFSTDRSDKCGKCTMDTYDSYSCKLWFACPELPIIPIPPYKIPNLFIDFSNLDVSVDVLLPKFNFIPQKLDLPQLPNLPEPPTFNFKIDFSKQNKFWINTNNKIKMDFMKIKLPQIPTIPKPPKLPELPSFIPNIKLKLPNLPPIPEIPTISPNIEWTINIASDFWKLFCILKWDIWLVSENQIKSKVEQLTQRTRNVPYFDYIDQWTFKEKLKNEYIQKIKDKIKKTNDSKKIEELKWLLKIAEFWDQPLKWFDYKLSTLLKIKYNFEDINNFFEWITENFNKMSTFIDYWNSYLNNTVNDKIWDLYNIENITNKDEVLKAVKNTLYKTTQEVNRDKLDKMKDFTSDQKRKFERIASKNQIKTLNKELTQDEINKIKILSDNDLEKYIRAYFSTINRDKLDKMKDFNEEEKIKFERVFSEKEIKKMNKKFTQEKINTLKEKSEYWLDENKDTILNEIAYIEYNKTKNNVYKWLNKILTNVNDTKKTYIQTIISLLNTKNKIYPNYENINKVFSMAIDNVIKKQTELKQLEYNIKNNYNVFLWYTSKNLYKLVWKKDNEKRYYTSLFKAKPEFTNFVKTQKPFTKEILNINKKEVVWYLNAINRHNNIELWINKTDYNETKKYLTKTNKNINKLLSLYNLEDWWNNWWWWNNNNNNTNTNNKPSNNFDITKYIKWIFIENDSWEIINTFYSNWYLNKVKKKYIYIDINNDWTNDMLLFDNNNIYIKYWDEHDIYSEYNNDSIFYVKNIDKNIINKKNFVNINNIELKINDNNFEVKNFKNIWQTFDNLKLNWLNSKFIWNNTDWYIIEMSERVDKLYDDNNDLAFIPNKTYILVLPNSEKYKNYTWYFIKFSSNYRKIYNLLNWTIFKVKFFNENQTEITLSLNDIPRKREYLRISTINKITKNWRNFYNISSPFSNQIIIWKQAILDNKWPIPNITINRPSTNEIFDNWLEFDLFVWTHYNLNILRNDNIWMENSFIKNSSNLIKNKKYNWTKTGLDTISNLYFTWEQKIKYKIWANDINGNFTQEEITLNIKKPKLTISNITWKNNLVKLISKISDNIDEWIVEFYKEKSNWKREKLTWEYLTKIYSKIITWGNFSFNNNLWLFNSSWKRFWEISNNNLIIYDNFKEKIKILTKFNAFSTNLYIYENYKKLFSISLKIKKILDIKIQNKNYKIKKLNDNIWYFSNWTWIIYWNNIIMYLKWNKIFVPTEFKDYIEWIYFFDNRKNIITINIKDIIGQKIWYIILK